MLSDQAAVSHGIPVFASFDDCQRVVEVVASDAAQAARDEVSHTR